MTAQVIHADTLEEHEYVANCAKCLLLNYVNTPAVVRTGIMYLCLQHFHQSYTPLNHPCACGRPLYVQLSLPECPTTHPMHSLNLHMDHVIHHVPSITISSSSSEASSPVPTAQRAFLHLNPGDPLLDTL